MDKKNILDWIIYWFVFVLSAVCLLFGTVYLFWIILLGESHSAYFGIIALIGGIILLYFAKIIRPKTNQRKSS